MQKMTLCTAWCKILASTCSIGIMIFFASCGNAPSTTQQPMASVTANTTTALVTANTTTQTPSGSTVAGASSREYPQTAYDKKNSTLLLFGGKSENDNLADTWTWDGHVWLQHHPPTSPGPITGASMAYDEATNQVVLFGGCLIGCNQVSGDTWTWDGISWTQQHPTTAPGPRTDASMVYDAALGQLVLFGGTGTSTSSNPPPLDDTWTWNGTAWKQQHPTTSPSARSGAGMAYDATAQTVVLFGGDDHSAPFPVLADTWTWNGMTWMQQHPATSPSLHFTNAGALIVVYGSTTSMAYNEATKQVVLVLFGGDDSGSQKIQVLWIWNGSNWLQQPIQHSKEDIMSVFYSTAQQTLFAYASSLQVGTFVDSLWKWTDQGWQQLVS